MRRAARSETSARDVRTPFSVAAAADSLFRPVASSSLDVLVDDPDVERDIERDARVSCALDSRRATVDHSRSTRGTH
jgi:hypothetical protein